MCKNINPMQIFLFDTLSDNWESIDIRPYSLSAQSRLLLQSRITMGRKHKQIITILTTNITHILKSQNNIIQPEKRT